jgi:hypothetical protein
MKTTQLLRSLVLALAAVVWPCAETPAAVLARYEFGGTFASSESTANATPTTFNSGPGLLEVAIENSQGQPSPAWYGENWSTTSDPEVARLSDRYAWFRVTVDPSWMMSLTNFSLDYRPHGAGPDELLIEIVPILNGVGGTFSRTIAHPDQNPSGEFDPASSPGGGTSTYKAWAGYQESLTGLNNLTGAYEIRIFGYDARQASRELLIDNVVLQGFVTPVPEPGPVILFSLAGVALLARKRLFR